MNIPKLLLAALLTITLGLAVGGVVGWAGDDDDDDDHRCKTLPFDEIDFFFELNDTDEDLGVQLVLDAEPWRKLKILAPGRKKILEIEGKGNLREFGLSSLFFESNEPSFDDMSMKEILELFPEGDYVFVGRTIEGGRLKGTATLTHDLPGAPEITSPEDGDEVPSGDLVVTWEEVTEPEDIEISWYQVIVTNDDEPSLLFDVRLPPDATSVTVPAAFLEEDTLYELEVLAREESGNQTISVLFFTTEE